MQKILTVEINDDTIVEMHLNNQGAIFLRNILNRMIEINENSDYHLMTPEWGGNELSSEQQNTGSEIKLMHHLKLFYWK